MYTLRAYYRRRRRRRRASQPPDNRLRGGPSLPPPPPEIPSKIRDRRLSVILFPRRGPASADVEFATASPALFGYTAPSSSSPPDNIFIPTRRRVLRTCSSSSYPPRTTIFQYVSTRSTCRPTAPSHRMTPTIQCFDDQSMQMPPASVLCNNMFFQENHHQLTSASDKTNSRPDVRTNHQWNPYLRNRHSTFSSKRNTSYTSALKPDDVKGLLQRRDNEQQSPSAAVTEEHLNAIRKRQALLLVTIQTMTLFHHNRILEHKLSALHRKVVQVQNRQRQRNIKSAAAEE